MYVIKCLIRGCKDRDAQFTQINFVTPPGKKIKTALGMDYRLGTLVTDCTVLY